jgi:hypothetical protein
MGRVADPVVALSANSSIEEIERILLSLREVSPTTHLLLPTALKRRQFRGTTATL